MDVLALEEEHAEAERARAGFVDAQNRCTELESLLSERDADLTRSRDVRRLLPTCKPR